MALSELNNVSLATTYELDDSFDTERFIKMRLRVCHDGINPNGSNFNIDDMNAARDTLKNIPILANVEFDEDGQPQFGSHDMSIEKDKVNEGEYRMIYHETPIGVIPEINNYEVSEFEGRNYVYVDGYIWKGYSNYAQDIIERDKNVKLSMEVKVNEFSYNAAKKVYNITDYKYTAITFLNNNLGTGMKKAMGTVDIFEKKDNTEQMLIIMQELKEALVSFNEKNTEEGGKVETMENIENTVFEDTTTSNEVPVVETPEANSAEPTVEAPVSGNSEDEIKDAATEVDAKFVKTFELSHDDIRCGLYAFIENDCFIADVYDDYFIYMNCAERKYLRQSYSKNGDDLSLNGDATEVFVSYITKEEKDALDNMRTNYSEMETEIAELKAFKAEIEKNKSIAEKQEILDKWSDNLKDNTQFEVLKDKLEEFSKEDLEKECKCIFADAKAVFTFAKTKEDSVIRIPIANETNTNDGPYGDLFAKYGNK